MSLICCLHICVPFTSYCGRLLLNALYISRVYALCLQQKLFEDRDHVKSNGYLSILLAFSPAFDLIAHLLLLNVSLHFAP